MEFEKIKHLHALASRLCDGDIDAKQLKELSALLDNDKDAIQEYLDYTSLHLNLSHKLRVNLAPNEFGDAVKSRLSEDANNASVASQVTRQSSKAIRAVTIFSLAASVLIVAAFLLHSYKSQSTFTARIIQKIDCDWDDERWGAPQSAFLEVGREIKLDRGLMVLEFGNGAEVTLEGPIHFSVLAHDRGNLQEGRLTASVPKGGRGFTVQIPFGEVIDLGTRFGVLVHEAGDCEAHVFQGNVLVRSNLGIQNQPFQEWKLTADEAIKLSPASHKIHHLAAQSAEFVSYSRSNIVASYTGDSSLPISDSSELVLWLDAGRGLQLDSSNRVIEWGDLSFSTDSPVNNAWQVDVVDRPLWIKETADGRPSVRFDGASHLVTTPFLSGQEITIVGVLLAHNQEQHNRQRGQLLSFNSTPNLLLETTLDKQFAGVLSTRTLASKGQRKVLVKCPLPSADMPKVYALVYSNIRNRVAVYVNGELVAESQAPSISMTRSPKFIGNSIQGDRGFVGDVHELLIFDTALTSDRCVQVCNSLMEKYRIAATQKEPRVLSGLIPDEQ
ncbi:LamG-like jellyroll fold domain-containing protein [Bythopirellula goksoeyrii]|uniref:FecR protein n=1 Tax=Bythopirellula goksoeyrii TaxID=1400387 RepID=A0A5B9Q9Q0_9BACT|nr:LamG-like jellyroll fold domain-containing protein [Bythopirellula goksoeyrii]QEG34335.1 FecR protein [Bythopirellula goksoeyrii]